MADLPARCSEIDPRGLVMLVIDEADMMVDPGGLGDMMIEVKRCAPKCFAHF